MYFLFLLDKGCHVAKQLPQACSRLNMQLDDHAENQNLIAPVSA